MYIVSACLLGANCKYNGGNNDNEAVKDFCEGHRILAVCPETAGGLTSPRPPAEQVRITDASDRHNEDSGANSSCCVNDCNDRGTENWCTLRVINKNGEDLTDAFRRGAEICLKKVLAASEPSESGSGEEIELAILKAKSPSCGSGQIYDGTFTGTLIEGDGVFARMLKEHGIRVITENELK